VFPNGDRYDGQFALLGGVPVRYGYGEHTTGFGMIYRGCWESDKMNGRGILLHPNGSKYDGDFVDNMMHGNGVYVWSDGSTYKGTFYKNRLEGDGSYMDMRNQTWRGQFLKTSADGLRFELNL